jgi:hypothetical protein
MRQKQSLLSYFQTLACLLERNEDPQANYFIIYAVLVLVMQIKLEKIQEV